jgi:hypothetical protein
MAGKTLEQQQSIRALGMLAKDKAAMSRADALRPQIEFAF